MERRRIRKVRAGRTMDERLRRPYSVRMIDALGWAAFLGSLIGTWLLMSERGYRDGLRIAWFAVTLSIPAWFHLTFRSVGLDAITGVSLATVIAMLFRPFPGARTRWVLSDVLIIIVVLCAVISEAANRVLIPGTVAELVRTWIFPYLLGRLAFEAWPEIRKTLPIIVILATCLAVFAILESFLRFNLLATISGKSWELLEKGEGFRWGLKRAQGIANHPIYFGLLMTLTLPWLLMAGRLAKNREGPPWWKATPFLGVAAGILSVSRSAHLALIVVFLSDLFFRKPRLRIPMAIVGGIGVLTVVVFREEILDMTGAYAAGEAQIGEDTVKIYGVEYPYTGTRHRDLLVDAYAEGIDQAGLFGFGTEVRDMPRDPNMDIRFLSIDHHYLLHHLRYGYLGTVSFILFAIGAAWNLLREAIARDGPYADLSAAMFGAFAAVAIIVRGVALSFDFGATWLFMAGFAASMHARRLAIPAGGTNMSFTSFEPNPSGSNP